VKIVVLEADNLKSEIGWRRKIAGDTPAATDWTAVREQNLFRINKATYG